MRRWVLLLLAGCEPVPTDGEITEADFQDAYVDRFCSQAETCGGTCPADAAFTVPTGCDFSGTLAQDCLDGVWACDGAEPVPAEICGEVYACAGTF